MTDSASHPAQFEGRCWVCKIDIHVGDSVVNYGGDWVHAGCPEEEVMTEDKPMTSYDLSVALRKCEDDEVYATTPHGTYRFTVVGLEMHDDGPVLRLQPIPEDLSGAR